jgi:hypothetical protein
MTVVKAGRENSFILLNKFHLRKQVILLGLYVFILPIVLQ